MPDVQPTAGTPPGGGAAGETAEALFRALARLHARGEIRLRLDYRRLDHLDSPVAVQADSTLWAYGLIAAAVAALWLAGWRAALAAAAVTALAYATLGRAYVRRRLRRRVEERALAQLDLWRALWRFGGVSLVGPDGAECAAPGGNWMDLVRGAAPVAAAGDKKIGP